MDALVEEVVDKEVTKVEKLVKEVNEGLVLVYIHGDSQRGYHKKGFQNDLVLDKEVDVEVNQEVDKKVTNVVNELVVQKFWLFMGKVLINVVQKCSHAERV